MAKRAERTGFTAKDVRKLRTCVLCSKLGIYKPTNCELNIPVVICIHNKAKVKADSRSYCHPQCYAEQMSVTKLLYVDADELDFIRLCDVSPFVMKQIMKMRPVGAQ